jgi:hypothetical protein
LIPVALRQLASALVLSLTACAVPIAHRRFAEALPYSEAPLPAAAKIFLVAGGVDVANFAAEVAAQRELWLARGYASDEIACYWAKPLRLGYRHDRKQYRRLAEALRPCYRASPAVLRDHLAQASAAGAPFLYLYVTSHGLTSLLPDNVPKDMLVPEEGALLDQYTLQLGAGPGFGVDPERLILELRAGAEPDDLVLSPAGLRRSLAAFPAEVPKLVVLQGCHAGGFAEALAQVPGTVALMAARHDRTSFGCDPGRDLTMFGAAYLRLLAERLDGAPPAIDWRALFDTLAAEIAAAEQAEGATPSLPVFVAASG